MTRRLRRLLVLSLAAVALAVAPAASAAPGDLDPSFGSGGTVRMLTNKGEVAIQAVAVQSDLKIVLAGRESPGSVVLVRLLPSGAVDTSFGLGGKVVTPFPGFGEARAVTLQPDGKIVIAGGADGATSVDFLVARYNADGSPDAGFGGGDGVQVVPVGLEDDSATAVAVGPGGNILATGEAELEGGKGGAGVVVLDSAGEPRPAFSGSGRKIVSTSSGDRGAAIAELADGRILVGDSSGAGGGDGFTLARLLPSGEFDPGFGGGDGIVKTPIPGAPGIGGRLTDFALRPDGRIVASGYGFDEGGSPPTLEEKFAAVGYLANGGLDPSFASTGVFSRRVGPLAGSARAVELGPTGKVLLAGGHEPVPNNESTALLRLDPLGGLDTSFGSGGEVIRGVTAPFGDYFADAALDAEERLVVLTTAYVGEGFTTAVVSRYLGDPRPLGPLPPQPAPQANQPARARLKAVPRQSLANKLKGFAGTAGDPDGHGVKRVQIALVRRVVKRGAGKSRLVCFALKNAKPGFKRTKRKGKHCPQRWLTVEGTAKWRFRLKGQLPPGRYVVLARAVDGAGLAETTFSRKLKNRYGFRVLR